MNPCKLTSWDTVLHITSLRQSNPCVSLQMAAFLQWAEKTNQSRFGKQTPLLNWLWFQGTRMSTWEVFIGLSQRPRARSPRAITLCIMIVWRVERLFKRREDSYLRGSTASLLSGIFKLDHLSPSFKRMEPFGTRRSHRNSASLLVKMAASKFSRLKRQKSRWSKCSWKVARPVWV